MKSIRGALLLLSSTLVLLLSGCMDPYQTVNRPNPAQYRCTDVQLKLVAQEMDICLKTQYLSDYCFAVAKATQCDKIASLVDK